jgi:hypothetical protein
MSGLYDAPPSLLKSAHTEAMGRGRMMLVLLAAIAVGALIAFADHSSDARLSIASLVLLLLLAVLSTSLAIVHERKRIGRASAQIVVGTRKFRIQESIKLKYSPEQVWALIYPAHNMPLLSPEVTRGYRVAGTPEGLGEQQAGVLTDGTIHVIQVLEYDPPRRAAVTMISPKPSTTTKSMWDLEPLGEHCMLTHGVEYEIPDLPAVEDALQEFVREIRDGLRDALRRIRTALADEHDPPPKGSGSRM